MTVFLQHEVVFFCDYLDKSDYGGWIATQLWIFRTGKGLRYHPARPPHISDGKANDLSRVTRWVSGEMRLDSLSPNPSMPSNWVILGSGVRGRSMHTKGSVCICKHFWIWELEGSKCGFVCVSSIRPSIHLFIHHPSIYSVIHWYSKHVVSAYSVNGSVGFCKYKNRPEVPWSWNRSKTNGADKYIHR